MRKQKIKVSQEMLSISEEFKLELLEWPSCLENRISTLNTLHGDNNYSITDGSGIHRNENSKER